MRNLLLLALTFITLHTLKSQSRTPIFDPDVQVTWLGVDFSHVHIVGDYTMFKSTPDFAAKINELIFTEPKKFDIAGMLNRSSVEYDVKYFEKKNDVTYKEATKNPGYNRADIEKIVKANKNPGGKGLGAFLVAESLNKAEEMGIFHLVVVNMADNKILLVERVQGEPKGFGLRNYWAGSIYAIIKDIRTTRFKQWKKDK